MIANVCTLVYIRAHVCLIQYTAFLFLKGLGTRLDRTLKQCPFLRMIWSSWAHWVWLDAICAHSKYVYFVVMNVVFDDVTCIPWGQAKVHVGSFARPSLSFCVYTCTCRTGSPARLTESCYCMLVMSSLIPGPIPSFWY